MSDAVIEAILLGILSSLGASCFAMSALGIALVFQIGYFLSGSLGLLQNPESLTEANIYLTSLLLPMSLFQSIYLRAHWNVPYVLYFGVIRAICTAAGITILISNDTIWLVRSLGIFLFISCIIFAFIQYQLHPNKRTTEDLSQFLYRSSDTDVVLMGIKYEPTADEETHLNNKDDQGTSFKVDSCSKRLVLMGLGLTSGLIRGLWGIAGVPIMFFALITNINFNEFRSSTAFAIILSEIVSIIQLYVIEDKMDIENKGMKYVAILCGGCVGVFIGNYLAKYYLNQFWFHLFILYLMFMGSIILILKDIWTAVFDIVITTTLLVIPIITFFICYVQNLYFKKAMDTETHTAAAQSFTASTWKPVLVM
eukprot:236117_1